MGTCGRSPALAPIVALLAVLALVASPTVAQAEGPRPDALDSLNNLRDRLLDAKKKANGKQRSFRDELEQAHIQKVLFYLKAFEGTTLFGGCPGQKVIGMLERIDTTLEQAEHDSGKLRKRRIERARDQAKEFETLIEGCAQGATVGNGDLIKGAVSKLLRQEKKGKLSGKELRQGNGRLFKRKRDILEDERIERCRVLEMFVQIERIDFLIIRAQETKPNDFKGDEKKATKKRRKIVERTLDQFQELYRLYLLLPCDPPAGKRFGCSGLQAAPNGMLAHAFTGGSCNAALVALSFEIVDGGSYSSFNVPMPSCAFENGSKRVRCTAPASANKTQIMGSSFGTMQPNPHCVKVIARNATGEQVEATANTAGFGTCL